MGAFGAPAPARLYEVPGSASVLIGGRGSEPTPRGIAAAAALLSAFRDIDPERTRNELYLGNGIFLLIISTFILSNESHVLLTIPLIPDRLLLDPNIKLFPSLVTCLPLASPS